MRLRLPQTFVLMQSCISRMRARISSSDGMIAALSCVVTPRRTYDIRFKKPFRMYLSVACNVCTFLLSSHCGIALIVVHDITESGTPYKQFAWSRRVVNKDIFLHNKPRENFFFEGGRDGFPTTSAGSRLPWTRLPPPQSSAAQYGLGIVLFDRCDRFPV